MSPKKARKILDSEETVSVEEIAEAQKVLFKRKKKITDPRNSLKAHQEWLRKNKEQTQLRNEIRKYWKQNS